MSSISELQTPKKSSKLVIAGAWLVVILPAAWGLSYTVKNAVKIFTRPDAPAASSNAPASASAAPSK